MYIYIYISDASCWCAAYAFYHNTHCTTPTPISSASRCCRKNVRTRGGKTITSSHKEIRTAIR